MSARDEILSSLRPGSCIPRLLDDYRTEVLAKAVGRLRAIPVDCTALTGPVWYGDGWNSAITVLEEIAEYQQPDDEEYPGELQRLRATVLALRVAALRKEDLTEVQRILNDHEDRRKKATAAAATATPDTLAAWLRQRFTASAVSWDNLNDTERDYWEHQALAVRRAVARGGFRTATPEAGDDRG